MNDQKIYLTPDAARRISQVVRDAERTARGEIERGKDQKIKPYQRLGITTTSISARSGKTPGFGNVQPYYDNGTTLVIDSNQAPLKVKNWTSSAVGSGLWVKYTVIDGQLYLDGTDCGGGAA